MNTQQFLQTTWQWNSPALVVCALAIAAYLFSFRNWTRTRIGFLIAGLSVFTLALVSPLDRLADGYLFSAHMLQHLLFLLVVPPLILLSLPAFSLPPMLDRILGVRWLTWLAGVGAMWIWHAPALCNAAQLNPQVHRIQFISLLIMGAMFWWPVLGSVHQRRIAPLPGIAYLFSACIACTLLGIILTFAPVSVCSVYRHPADPLGILPLIRDGWGLTAERDQQLGGLLMWVPPCLIYLAGIIGLLARWYRPPVALPEPSLVESRQ
jgi:putative membrane protein